MSLTLFEKHFRTQNGAFNFKQLSFIIFLFAGLSNTLYFSVDI